MQIKIAEIVITGELGEVDRLACEIAKHLEGEEKGKRRGIKLKLYRDREKIISKAKLKVFDIS